VGRILGCCEVKIASGGAGAEGEIMVTGLIVMLGYSKDPAQTAATMSDGWFRTGDIGRMDADGYLYATGRLKNMILLSNGKNIYPEEIEGKISMHPSVDDAVVYCSDDGVIALEYYSSSGKVEGMERFVEQVNAELPMYAQIGRVRFRGSPFPKTTTKKIKRKDFLQSESVAHKSGVSG
jgi:long-chain acyl-CoA synthetase